MTNIKIYKSIIVLSGVIITFLIKNLFLFTEYVFPILLILIVILLSFIYILNRKEYIDKTSTIKVVNNSVNSNKSDNINENKSNTERDFDEHSNNKNKTLRSFFIDLSSKKLESYKMLLLFLSVFIFGVLLGFYFKKPNSTLLHEAALKNSEWEKDIYIERLRAETSFFELETWYGKIFDFNWGIFLVVITTTFLIYYLNKKTILLDVLKSKIKPYLK